jgi:hypothetical protein
MIAIDDQGDFIVDNDGNMTESTNPPQQNFIAEVRCLQTTYIVEPTFGRNYLTWTLSQNVNDRIADLIRISKKYLTINNVSYVNGVYSII